MAQWLCHRLVGTGFVSRYRNQPIAVFLKGQWVGVRPLHPLPAPMAQWLCHRLVGTGFASRYRHQIQSGFLKAQWVGVRPLHPPPAPMAQWLCHGLMGWVRNSVPTPTQSGFLKVQWATAPSSFSITSNRDTTTY